MDERPKTAQELLALPIGPAFSQEVFDLTEEDWARGFIEFRGLKHAVSRRRARLIIPIAPEVVVFASHDKDVMAANDADGEWWSLGRYADGSWFRRQVG